MATGNLCVTRAEQSLRQPGGVGCGERRRGHMCAYNWSMLMYGRNPHNTAQQLPFN